jgi:hypothetical protein
VHKLDFQTNSCSFSTGSEELQYPTEEYAADDCLRQYISDNIQHEQYSCEVLMSLWKGNIQTIIDKSRENEESRHHAIRVVRQIASCLEIDLGAAIPIPVGKDRTSAKPTIIEVNRSMPHLSKELKLVSENLWNKWGTGKTLIDLLGLAEEEEANENDVKAFVQILARSVGVLNKNISKLLSFLLCIDN